MRRRRRLNILLLIEGRHRMAEIGRLPGKQARAIEALLTCATVRAAAEQAGVPERTLFRWLGEDAFSNELATRRREIQKQVLSSITEHAESAIRELAELATGSESDHVRRAACKDILETCLKVQAQLDTDERLARLERILENAESENA